MTSVQHHPKPLAFTEGSMMPHLVRDLGVNPTQPDFEAPVSEATDLAGSACQSSFYSLVLMFLGFGLVAGTLLLFLKF